MNWDGLDALLKAKPLDISGMRDSEYFGSNRVSFYMSPPKEDHSKRLGLMSNKKPTDRNKENQQNPNKQTHVSFDIKEPAFPAKHSIPKSKPAEIKPNHSVTTYESKLHKVGNGSGIEAKSNVSTSNYAKRETASNLRFAKPPVNGSFFKNKVDEAITKESSDDMPAAVSKAQSGTLNNTSEGTSDYDTLKSVLMRLSWLEQENSSLRKMLAGVEHDKCTLEDKVLSIETRFNKFMAEAASHEGL